jgi:hypothetical protein
MLKMPSIFDWMAASPIDGSKMNTFGPKSTGPLGAT